MFEIGNLVKHTKTGGIYEIAGTINATKTFFDCDTAFLVGFMNAQKHQPWESPSMGLTSGEALKGLQYPFYASIVIPVFIQNVKPEKVLCDWTLYRSRSNHTLYARPTDEFNARFTLFTERPVAA